uniref:von Willebrand factor A domain-containing protein 5A n=1 Tax=Peromyscus maniculatus bairdii TaxID=230844 RepID=A0A8C8UGY7_PERMB
QSHSCVALKSIAVTLSIKDFVAGVSVTLNYENEEKVPLEAFFVFPTDEDTAVYSFEALVDGKKIVAELQDKYEAHLKYEEDLSGGFHTYLLEEDKCSKDVFRCNVGNMQPGSKVTLTLKYVQELHLEDDGALCYVLPATLNPRYHLSDQSVDSCLDLKTPIVPLEDLPYTLSMVATISSQLGIRTIQCNCPLSSIDYTGENKTSAQVSLAEGHKFDRDVELLIFYRKVHSPCVTVEMGMSVFFQISNTLMGAPSAMVSFYPDIPEVETSTKCGEFVFFMDCSGSMKNPMSRQNRSQLRIDAAKETLILLLKSLPLGCYFNIYEFGSTHEAFFPKSVRYTQESMERAVEKVKLMLADLGGTELLTPLRKVFRKPPIPGHPLQVFVFTDGEVAESFNVIKEVKFHSKRHRCFSFGIGEGVSTSLIKNLARVSGGTAEFITGSDRMQSKALRSLRRSLQSIVEDVSLSWDLPPGLFVHMLSPEQTVVFRGQRIITYSLLAGQIPQDEATGEVCLKYTSHGKSYEEKVTFSLHPKPDDNLTSHRLAAKSMIQARDFGYKETTLIFKRDVLDISLESGIISSFTIFVAINKELNEPVYGPLYHRDIPRPILFSASYMRAFFLQHTLATAWLRIQKATQVGQKYSSNRISQHFIFFSLLKGSMEHTVAQLILLQNADGSWDMNEDLAKVLGSSLEDIKAAHPTEVLEPSSAWATVLAVIWLHANGKELKDEWELLERKAVVWLQNNAGRSTFPLMSTANKLLKTSVSSSIFTFKD